ncbi:MAG: glycosyltransferase family 2 protein [Candidatus Merdivicinus sp.]|jgi:cellulose synthase/poly-beta-1,6-N-acetylglucosamine synthase-like glycosyltransferase
MKMMLSLLAAMAWGFSFVFTLYAGYNLLVALAGLKKEKKFAPAAVKKRFAMLIAARNEECVIGNLVQTLKEQDYPSDLYDIYVIPNNCTDDTAGAARRAGAKILECTVPVKSKGEVLTFAFDHLLAGVKQYDAFCVFDADNLVDPGFLNAMNDALCSGAKAGQAYRDSKNPYDTAMSGSYSIYYWMINRFYNRSRSNIGMTAMINGSGFMVSADLIREMGGFHTYTMTEDIEFTTQCVLRDVKVEWVPEAHIYDEQPLTFAQSWKQRKRWSTGLLQGCARYLPALVKRSLTCHSRLATDQMIFFLAPVMQVVCFLSMVISAVMALFYLQIDLFPQTEVFWKLFSPIGFSFLLTTGSSLITLILEKKWNWKLWKAALHYWVFVMSWIPINLVCLFKRTTVWDEIKHTRAIAMSELSIESK